MKNQFNSIYDTLINEKHITPITESYIFNELKVKCIVEGYYISDEILQESAKITYELYQDGWPSDVLEEGWKSTLGHTLAYVAGALDPTGIVDTAHAVQLFLTGHYILGIISLLGAIPYIGDTAKLLVPAVKGGKPLTGPAAKIAQKIIGSKDNLAKLLEKPVRFLLKNNQFAEHIAKRGWNDFAAMRGMDTAEFIAKKFTRILVQKLKALSPPKILKFAKPRPGQSAVGFNTLHTVRNVGSAAKSATLGSTFLGTTAGMSPSTSPFTTKESIPTMPGTGGYNFSGVTL